jgi:hypothetical protein
VGEAGAIGAFHPAKPLLAFLDDEGFALPSRLRSMTSPATHGRIQALAGRAALLASFC